MITRDRNPRSCVTFTSPPCGECRWCLDEPAEDIDSDGVPVTFHVENARTFDRLPIDRSRPVPDDDFPF